MRPALGCCLRMPTLLYSYVRRVLSLLRLQIDSLIGMYVDFPDTQIRGMQRARGVNNLAWGKHIEVAKANLWHQSEALGTAGGSAPATV